MADRPKGPTVVLQLKERYRYLSARLLPQALEPNSDRAGRCALIAYVYGFQRGSRNSPLDALACSHRGESFSSRTSCPEGLTARMASSRQAVVKRALSQAGTRTRTLTFCARKILCFEVAYAVALRSTLLAAVGKSCKRSRYQPHWQILSFEVAQLPT